MVLRYSLPVGALCKRAGFDCAVSNRAYGDGFPSLQLVCRSRSPDLDLCFVFLPLNRGRERALSNYRRLVSPSGLRGFKPRLRGRCPFPSTGQRNPTSPDPYPFNAQRSRSGDLDLQRVPGTAKPNQTPEARFQTAQPGRFPSPSDVKAQPNAVVRDRQIPNSSRVSLPINGTAKPNGQDLAILTYRGCLGQRNPTKPRRRGFKPRLPVGVPFPSNVTAQRNPIVRDRQIPNRTRVSIPINGTAKPNGQDQAILTYRLQTASFPIR